MNSTLYKLKNTYIYSNNKTIYVSIALSTRELIDARILPSIKNEQGTSEMAEQGAQYNLSLKINDKWT